MIIEPHSKGYCNLSSSSKGLMSIHLSCWVEKVCLTKPLKLNFLLYRLFIVCSFFVLNFRLSVRSFKLVAVFEVPCPLPVWFIFCKLSLIVRSIGQNPSSRRKFIVDPIAHQPHPSVSVNVRSFSLLLSELPPSWIGILVGIGVYTFSMFQPILPLT